MPADRRAQENVGTSLWSRVAGFLPAMSVRFERLSEFVDWFVGLQFEHDGRGMVHWFRGHPHRGLALKPGALRQTFAERASQNGDDRELVLERIEQGINQQYRREAASLLPQRLDPVDLYFLAQHHGLPTRLLDWTTNGLAALFFTAVDEPQVDGEVIVATPTWRMTTSDESDPRVKLLAEAPFPQRHSKVVQAIGYLFGEAERPKSPLILPVLPDLRSRRMLQQGACFTLHLPGAGDVEESAVTRCLVPHEQKGELVRSLRALGINWSTLFPDLDHLCFELRSRWSDSVGQLATK